MNPTLSCRSDKGTTVRYEVFEAGAVFPSASVNRQALRVALTPCVPLSRLAGEGDKGGEGNTARPPVHAHAGKIAPASVILCRTDVPLSALSPSPARRAREGRTAVRPYTPLPPCGRGAGVRATKNAHPLHAANSTDVPLSASRRGSSISLASNFLQVRQVFLELLCRVVKGNTALA